MCNWVFKKGKNKGEQCRTKPSGGGDYCSKHVRLAPQKPYEKVSVDLEIELDETDFVSPFVNDDDFGSFGTEEFKKSLEDEIIGKHMVCQQEIYGHLCESIINNVMRDTYPTVRVGWDKNSHCSGKDMKIGKHRYSIKSGVIDKNGIIKQSSYRLGKSTKANQLGKFVDIYNDIKQRDSSFDYYLTFYRKHNSNATITYYFCVIPKTNSVFDIKVDDIPELVYGKKENIKGQPTQWRGSNWYINFSQSSQLWFSFSFDDIKKYVVHECTVSSIQTCTYKYIKYAMEKIYQLKEKLTAKDREIEELKKENKELKKKKDLEIEELKKALEEATKN